VYSKAIMNDNPLDHLIKLLGSLPGLGNRSARRIALHLLSKRGSLMVPLADALKDTAENIKNCNICNTLDLSDPCNICRDPKRDKRQICVVAQVSDVWAIERTGAFKGTYHVLGGVLCALDGIGPEDLGLGKLKLRLEETENREEQEVILALSATVDGQSTAHYIADMLMPLGIKVSKLAHGMPVGGELDYLDDGTITTALRSRA